MRMKVFKHAPRGPRRRVGAKEGMVTIAVVICKPYEIPATHFAPKNCAGPWQSCSNRIAPMEKTIAARIVARIPKRG